MLPHMIRLSHITSLFSSLLTQILKA